MTRRRVVAYVVVAVLLALSGSTAPLAAQSTAVIDPDLQRTLEAAAADARITAIVTYRSAPTDADVAALRSLGLSAYRFKHLPTVAVFGTADRIRRTFTLANVRSVWNNSRLTYHLHESVRLIGAETTWDSLGLTGKGIGIAILDSGVDATHPDLALGPKTPANVKVAGEDAFVAGANVYVNAVNSDTSSGHGTHVAGIAAGSGAASKGAFGDDVGGFGYYTGTAPEANILGISAGETLVILSALAGFDWVLDNQAKYNIRVVNNSWGSTGAFNANNPINVATSEVAKRGITVVFSSGNSGPNNNTLNTYSVAPWVIGVAASCKNPDGARFATGQVLCNQGEMLANFSSRGIPGDPLYHPTITAPGVQIVSARTATGAAINALSPREELATCVNRIPASYVCATGTSMSAPHITGIVALLYQAYPRITPDQVKSTLVKTASKLQSYQEYQVGAGVVNTLKAAAYALKLGGSADLDYVEWSGTIGVSAITAVSSDTRTFTIPKGLQQMIVQVTWANPLIDLDLYVTDPDGRTTIAGEFLTATERMTILFPKAGTWKVEVRGFISVAEPYEGLLVLDSSITRRRR